MHQILTYPLINQLLAKKDPYTEVSWQNNPIEQKCLQRVEKLLATLEQTELMPEETKDGLVYWLLHTAPLSQWEIDDVRKFAFEIDYY